MRATNWSALQVDEMWSMISRHDGVAHQQLISGWRKSYELVLQHISGVQRYREGLAAAWPPHRSPASAAYMERLDALITSLWDTYEAAVENHRALTGATGALNSARQSMEEIQREHAANQLRLAQYEEDVRVHNLVGGKARGMPPRLPVADGRQAQLESQARTVMSNLSNELAQAQVSLITPRPYNAPSGVESGSRPFGTKSAEVLPLPTPLPNIDQNSRQVPSDFLRPSRESAGNDGRGMLGDADNRPIQHISKPTSFTPQLASAHPALDHNLVIGEHTQASSTSAAAAHFSGVMQPPQPTKTPSGAKPSDAPPRLQVVPNHGVIGSIPASGSPQGVPGNGNTHRVNPIGGVIGGHGAPTPYNTASDRNGSSRRTIRINPDNPWAVRQGIDPVIHPDPVPDFDPGPVIGFRRKC